MDFTENKTLIYYSNVDVTISCPMEFDAFPMDEHSCHFIMFSPSYTKVELGFLDPTLKTEVHNRLKNYREATKPFPRR